MLTFDQALRVFAVLLTLVTIVLIIFYLRYKRAKCHKHKLDHEHEIPTESDNDHDEQVLEELIVDLDNYEYVKKKKRLSVQEKRIIEELSDRIDELKKDDC